MESCLDHLDLASLVLMHSIGLVPVHIDLSAQDRCSTHTLYCLFTHSTSCSERWHFLGAISCCDSL